MRSIEYQQLTYTTSALGSLRRPVRKSADGRTLIECLLRRDPRTVPRLTLSKVGTAIDGEDGVAL